jgi:[ribosomal protein S18]-alanine N-acetyltransferase
VSAILNMPPMHLRAMTEADLSAVMEIERQGYAHPWTEGIFRDCMRVGYFCRVLELDGRVAGYGIMSTGAGEAHVLNICVTPRMRRRGLGRSILSDLIEAARRLHAKEILLEVRPSNESALGLYNDIGFSEVGIRKAYYPGARGREDALIMAMSLE